MGNAMEPAERRVTKRASPRRISDPGRAERIADAAIRVVESKGLEGLTHRAVAAEAQVPLGSTTYHFRSLDDILVAAVKLARKRNAAAVSAWIATFPPDPDLPSELANYVMRQATEIRGTTLVEYELSLAALRRPALRPLAVDWSLDITRALADFVEFPVADALTGMYDGLLLRALISTSNVTRQSVEQAFRRIIARDPQT